MQRRRFALKQINQRAPRRALPLVTRGALTAAEPATTLATNRQRMDPHNSSWENSRPNSFRLRIQVIIWLYTERRALLGCYCDRCYTAAWIVGCPPEA